MSENFKTSVNMETFNRCLVCQVEVCEGSLNNLKLCQKFVTLASRYYKIASLDKSLVNLHKTLKLNQLKSESDCAQFVSCDNCVVKIKSFCNIYKEFSLLQIQLNASARKITQSMKDVQQTKPSNNINNKGPSPESQKFDYFRNQFYSKAAQQLPHVRLRKLELDDVSTFKQEKDQFYVPIEDENFSAVAPPPPPTTNSGTQKSHRAKKIRKVAKLAQKTSTGFENLVVDSSSIGAAGNTVEMLKSLPQGSLLIVPGTTTDEERRYKCRYCEKAYKTRENRNWHENIHLQKFRCRFCNQRFNFRFRMKVHERTHTGIKPFKCSVCAETFREKRTCTSHVWRVHKGNAEVIEDLNHEQESNLVETKIEANLNPAQIKTTPNSKDAERPFKCPTCNNGFAKRRNLSVHMKIHSRPFNCEICDARFSRKFALEIHTRTHTGERPYLCPICFRTFAQSQSCKIHQRQIHKIANGVVINAQDYGVKVVPENGLPKENQNVTPGNQAEHEIQGAEKLQGTNGDEDNFILPETQQEVPMDLEESEVKLEATQLEDPLGDL